MTGTSMCEGGAATVVFASGEVALVEVDAACADAEEVDVRGVDPTDTDVDADSVFTSPPCLLSNSRTCYAVFATHQASRCVVQWLSPSFHCISSSNSSFLLRFLASLRFEISSAILAISLDFCVPLNMLFSLPALTAASSFSSSSESASDEA